MYDVLLTAPQKALREEVREFARWVPREMILGMDRDEIRFPREFLQEAGRRGLLGCRYARECSIWTGTNEVMSAIIAHEWYRAHGDEGGARRDHEADAASADAPDEKIF